MSKALPVPSSPDSVYHYKPSDPGPAYNLHRIDEGNMNELESLEYSSQVDDSSESYLAIHTLGGDTSVTGHAAHLRTTSHDATETIHEMHLALLYLLSNPEEFQKSLAYSPARGATTLAEWNAEYDAESMTEAESTSALTADYGNNGSTPLPFVVFADDAEVVLPQAHTASQLFGVERLEGIELEAAAGIQSISQLFLRWLALMPQGDHLNIVEPPGLTVMRIAGGRYRVTAAHRVVWQWACEFARLDDATASTAEEAVSRLQVGDLVTMTIVDVFETDNNGKLLSYCPTFDNRAIHKTHQTTEAIRKNSSKLLTAMAKAQKSKTATLLMKKAQLVAKSVKQKVDEAVHSYNGTSPGRSSIGSFQHESKSLDDEDLEKHEV